MPGLTLTNEPKRTGYDFFREVLGSPKYVVAPMVDQSELAWRTLSRRYGAQLVYTPMINAKMFAEGTRKGYREQNFNITQGEEGGPADRPLIVQFCANDSAQLLASARVVAPHCDAIDINLGCPQDIARRGHYGAFLQDDWKLIGEMISTLHRELSVPVTAKFRVFETIEKTVEYAKMLESAGAQILTCHGRLREQRGHNSGLADWDKIRAVKQAVSVPVIANGNILFHDDIARCLAETGADAVMSAEGNLYNPAIFCAEPSPSSASSIASSSQNPSDYAAAPTSTFPTGLYPRNTTLALEYLAIVRTQKTPTSPSAVKGHLFKLLRPALALHTDLRAELGRVRVERGAIGASFTQYEDIIRTLDARLEADIAATSNMPLTYETSTGLPVLPHWLAQPYFRPLPVPSVDTHSSSVTSRSVHKDIDHTPSGTCVTSSDPDPQSLVSSDSLPTPSEPLPTTSSSPHSLNESLHCQRGDEIAHGAKRMASPEPEREEPVKRARGLEGEDIRAVSS